jgi:dTDP-4-dehydrorhamnose 3,5-epimerase
MQAAFVPTGVAHGFYFPEPASLCYSVSHYWNMTDEIGCRWDDPALGLNWDVRNPELSPRDTTAGTAKAMTDEFLAAREKVRAGYA